jgi:hypothetical protein
MVQRKRYRRIFNMPVFILKHIQEYKRITSKTFLLLCVRYD